jgi:hypothetical protein
MMLAFIILAHRLPNQLASLLSVLRSPHAQVYLHIDRRAPVAPFNRALGQAPFDDPVCLARRSTRWGGPGMVDASLDGLARGLADGCEYFMLISGQDFPLRPIEEIVEFAATAGPRSYLESFALPTTRWRFGGHDRTDFYTYDLLGRRETCIPRGEDVSFFNWRGRMLNQALRLRTALMPPRRFPAYARPFGGSQWWNLSRTAAEHVLRFLDEHPDYRAYHEYTLAPDELFFQSILLGNEFAGRDQLANDSLRFMVFPEGASHPRTLTVDDLPAIGASDELFARKFDATVDETVLRRLREHVARSGGG